MSRPEDPSTETDLADRLQEEEEGAESPEPVTRPIDEDVTGSVNAALHEADE
jgi:hypothetical protein